MRFCDVLGHIFPGWLGQLPGEGGRTLRKSWRCSQRSKISYPIYDQNLRFPLLICNPTEKSIPNVSDQRCNQLPRSELCLRHCEESLLMVLSIMMKKKLLLKTTYLKTSAKTKDLFVAKMVQINTPFMTKTAETPYPLGLQILT